MSSSLRKAAARWGRAAFFALALTSSAMPVFARAGGGGHYSGGGHSFGGGGHYGHYSGGSHSFGGRGSSTAEPVWVDEILLVACLFVALLLPAIRQFYDSSVLSRGAEAQGDVARQANLAVLKARDPGFDPEAFLARASAAFLKIQQAWSNQDMSPARPFVSDGVMERFSIQLAMQIDEKMRNKMEQVRVLGAEILQIESDAHFDVLHACFHASAVDTDVSLADGSALRGNGEPEEFEEVWSFLRRPSAQTLSKPGLLEGYCPNCGAPLQIADAAQCPACKSWVNSGEYDWVLCKITQACEWAMREPKDIPGYAALAAKDADLDDTFLEDRVSVAFWRWQYALWKGDPSFMRSIAADHYCQSLDQEIRGPGRSFYRDAAIGGAEVLALGVDDSFDQVHVLVKWSGCQCAMQGEGGQLSGEPVLHQHVFILGRKLGVSTDSQAGLSSTRCPNCGAPSARRDVSACEYCGASFNDGGRNWVVTAIVPIGLWHSPASVLGPAPVAPVSEDAWVFALSPMDSLSVMAIAMAAHDGLNEKEAEHLAVFAKSQGVPLERVQALTAAARSGHLDFPRPQNQAQAMACLRGLVRMSLADGALTRGEKQALLAFGAKTALTQEQIKLVFKSEKEEARLRAKSALAARKALA